MKEAWLQTAPLLVGNSEVANLASEGGEIQAVRRQQNEIKRCEWKSRDAYRSSR